MAKVEEIVTKVLKVRDVVVPLTSISLDYSYDSEWYFVAAQNETKIILPTSHRYFFVSFFEDSFAEAELLEVSEFDNFQEFYDYHLGPDWDITIDC